MVEGAYHIRIFERMEQIASVLGEHEDAKEYAIERQRLIELFNQIFIATDGAGMFSKFPGSQIDGYLLSDRRKIYTFGRQEFFGVPNERAVKRFEDLFLIDLNKYIERGRCL